MNIMLLGVIFPKVIFETKFNHFNIRLGTSSNFYHYFQYRALNDKENWQFRGFNYSFFNISYDQNNIKLKIEPRGISIDDALYPELFSLNVKSKVSCDILKNTTVVIPYILSLNKTNISWLFNYNYYGSDFINTYIVSSLRISELKGTNRYKKFFGIKYNGIQFNNQVSVDLDELNIFIYTDRDWNWNDNRIKNYLDFYLGVEFDKFIFSWHFTNVLSENYIINYGGDIKNLNMKYFSIKWKFDD